MKIHSIKPVALIPLLMCGVLLSMFQCTPENDPSVETLLMGTWYLDNMDSYYELESSIDQVAVFMMSECEGSIDLAGFLEAGLTFFMDVPDEGESHLVVFNAAMLLPLNEMTETGYALSLRDNGQEQSAMLIVQYDQDSSNFWFSDTLSFSYDAIHSSLSISAGSLSPFFPSGNVSETDVIYISGELSHQTYPLTSNNIVSVPFEPLLYQVLESRLVIEDDHTLAFYDQYEGFDDTTLYHWELDSEDMLLVQLNQDLEPDDGDTLRVEFTVDTHHLNLRIVRNCEAATGSGSLQDCLEETETLFQLEPGSLIGASLITQISMQDSESLSKPSGLHGALSALGQLQANAASDY